MGNTASPRDRAFHEAAHAVVYWWWVHRPGGSDDGTGGHFLDLTIVARENDEGHFTPIPYIVTQGDMDACEHRVMGMLAGPVSDELRGLAWPGGGKRDLRNARDYARNFMNETDIEPYIDSKRARTIDLLTSEPGRSMVADLATVLLGRYTVGFDLAVTTMKAASLDR